MNEWMDECIVDGWASGPQMMSGWMNEWMDGLVGGLMDK